MEETVKNLEKINRITTTTLQKKTGKSWQEWFAILNTVDALHLSHRKIAEYLFDKHEIDEWWAQMITVGYEQYHCKREQYQKPDGYEISVSKTIDVTVDILYAAWMTDRIRKKWLSESITIRKATPNKSIRITWTDEVTHVTVNFYEKGDNKSQVVVQHSKIIDKKSAEEKKLFWKKTLLKINDNI